MKTMLRVALATLLIAGSLAAQKAPSAEAEKVLALMDRSAASFHGVEANFMWDQYTAVVQDHDKQEGSVWFRRSGKGAEMAADITQPANAHKYVVCGRGKARIFQYSTKQMSEYDLGKNRGAFESFLLLGFGGRGHDLLDSFEVSFGGEDNTSIRGAKTYKLELTPKAGTKIREMFSHVTLWIDQERGVSLMQKFLQPSGDYRLALYANVRSMPRIEESVFDINAHKK